MDWRNWKGRMGQWVGTGYQLLSGHQRWIYPGTLREIPVVWWYTTCYHTRRHTSPSGNWTVAKIGKCPEKSWQISSRAGTLSPQWMARECKLGQSRIQHHCTTAWQSSLSSRLGSPKISGSSKPSSTARTRCTKIWCSRSLWNWSNRTSASHPPCMLLVRTIACCPWLGWTRSNKCERKLAQTSEQWTSSSVTK